MTPLVGLPLAVVVGLLADLAGRWLARTAGFAPGGPSPGSILKGTRVKTGAARDRLAALAVGGAVTSGAGAGLASAAVIGAVPGSLPLVVLSLVIASAGARLCLSDTATDPRPGDESAARPAVGPAALLEVLTLLAVIAAFLRWRAPDLEAIRGAQAVLGPGVTTGSATRVAALVLAGLGLVLAGGARVGPLPARAPSAGHLLAALCRWWTLGAAALVAAALVAGPQLGDARSWPDMASWIAATGVAAVLAGFASAVLGSEGRGARLQVPVTLVLVVVVGTALGMAAS